MKVFFICLIILFSLSIVFVDSVQGKLLKYHPNFVEVSLQIQIRNAEGQLVAYHEPTQVYIGNSESAHEYLDNKKNKTIIQNEGIYLEVIKWEQTGIYKPSKLETTFNIMYNGELAISVLPDAFISEQGDNYSASWKVVRLLN